MSDDSESQWLLVPPNHVMDTARNIANERVIVRPRRLLATTSLDGESDRRNVFRHMVVLGNITFVDYDKYPQRQRAQKPRFENIRSERDGYFEKSPSFRH